MSACEKMLKKQANKNQLPRRVLLNMHPRQPASRRFVVFRAK